MFLCSFGTDGSYPQMCKAKGAALYTMLIFSTMNSVWLRPSSQVEDVYNFLLGGPNIDFDKISTSSEEFAKVFFSLTKRTDILFGDILWVSKYRLEQSFF